MMLESIPLPSVSLFLADEVVSTASDIVVIGMTVDGKLSESGEAIDKAGDGILGQLFESGILTGKSGRSHLVAVPLEGRPAVGVLVVGLGDREKLTTGALSKATATAIRGLIDQPRECVIVTLAEWNDGDADRLVSAALTACEGQCIYQSDPSIVVPVRIGMTGISEEDLKRGESLGHAVNLTRRLVNEPAGIIYPESFVTRVEKELATTSLTLECWDENRLESEGCRAMLAVGQGSSRPPRLLMIRHSGTKSDGPTLAIVGKGVTFDSGGLSLKPSDGMVDMKCDMAGAATVVGVMRAVSELDLPINVVGYCGLAENMVSGDSYKLGDVIETRSGKTIEILNTDAEGRVVLSDVLDVAIQHSPSAMVDLATLTGACMVALGHEVAGLMTNDKDLASEISAAAERQDEYVWELPMHSFYDEKIKSKVADIKNIGEGRWGGAITAAKFLEQFVGSVPWVHLDIAGPAFADSPKPERDAGATGVMVRTLVDWVAKRADS